MWLQSINFSVKTILLLYTCYSHVAKLIKCKVLDSGTIQVAENQNIYLKCQNHTNGLFAKFTWTSNAYSEGKVMVYDYDIAQKETIATNFTGRVSRYNGTSLHIRNARLGDSGNYECNLIFYNLKSKTLGVSETAIYDVIVISPPKRMNTYNDLVAAPKGQNVTIQCNVQGMSPFDVKWSKIDGNFTKNVVIREENKTAHIYYIRQKNITFTKLSERDTGQYQCVANNLGGSLSKVVTLRMQSSPMFTGASTYNINVYDTGKIYCKAKGYPAIEFSWRFFSKDGDLIVLAASATSGKYSTSNNIYNSISEEGESSLTIEQVEKYDLNSYTCVAKNTVAEDQTEIRLEGFAPPEPPFILQIGEFSHKVTLLWRLGDNGGKPITSITIKYRNSKFVEKWTKLQITKSLTEYTITNLEPGTPYDFKVLATNEIGDSKYSKIKKAATPLKDFSGGETENSADFLQKFSPPAIIGIIGGTLIALVIGLVCICLFVRRMHKREDAEVVNQPSLSFGATMIPMHHSATDGGQMEMEPLVSTTDQWEFPKDRLTITTVLGAGAFGVVMRGLAQGIKGSVGQITVAVKTVRDSTNDAATKDLLAELQLLKLIPEHPNVVGLLGCCTRCDPLYVIVEYCANGDLQGFLRSSRGIYERYYKTSFGGAVPDLTSKMLLTFAWQVSKGMAHLSTMKVIHRDLAARNILVDDQLICKVSDFGFARDIYVEDHYLKRSAGGRFPIKWMAIESLLDGLSTTKSDVWSFGVVLWELVTLGASPYPGMSSYEVVGFLQDGYRMPRPKHASTEIYALMMECWSVSPGRRPPFNDISERCYELVQRSDDAEFINMSFYQDHLYVNFDGNSDSAIGSTSTTPHGTLGRKDRVNTISQSAAVGAPPRPLRSISQTSVPSGRSNSVVALSERSATTVSNRDERAALITPVPQ